MFELTFSPESPFEMLALSTTTHVDEMGVGPQVASAQETRKWVDVDCTHSKIVAPSGLKCRATQLYSGSDSKTVGAGAGGQFQRWTAYGTVSDCSQVFYFASEASEPQSWIRPTASLEEVVRGFNRDFQSAKDFTQLAQLNGGDYQRFTNPKGDPCVAIRKLGGSQSAGYQWFLVAGKCAAKGGSISESEIANFLASAGFRLSSIAAHAGCLLLAPFRKSAACPAKSAVGGRPDMTPAGRHFAV
jgi:hypothetical protein